MSSISCGEFHLILGQSTVTTSGAAAAVMVCSG